MSDGGLIADFRHALTQEIRKEEEQLGGGGAPDFAAYARAVGRIAGLKRARLIFDDAWQAYRQDDDDS